MTFKRGDHVKVIGGGWCEGMTGYVVNVYPTGTIDVEPDEPNPKNQGFWTNANHHLNQSDVDYQITNDVSQEGIVTSIQDRISAVLQLHQFVIRPTMQPRYACSCGATFETNPGPHTTHVAERITKTLGLT